MAVALRNDVTQTDELVVENGGTSSGMKIDRERTADQPPERNRQKTSLLRRKVARREPLLRVQILKDCTGRGI